MKGKKVVIDTEMKKQRRDRLRRGIPHAMHIKSAAPVAHRSSSPGHLLRYPPGRPAPYATPTCQLKPNNLTAFTHEHGSSALRVGSRLRHPRLRLLARKEIDVSVAARRAAQKGPVRVERRGGDGGPAVLLEEARVGLHAGELLAV